jgi:hypothetical protein
MKSIQMATYKRLFAIKIFLLFWRLISRDYHISFIWGLCAYCYQLKTWEHTQPFTDSYSVYNICYNICINVRPLPFFCNKVFQILFFVGKQIMASISRTVGFKVLGESSYVHGSNTALGYMTHPVCYWWFWWDESVLVSYRELNWINY